VNNLHIITLYKLHNKLSYESRLPRSSCRTCRAMQLSSSCRASRVRRVECRAVLFKLETVQKCMGSTRRTCRVVSCRDVTSQVEFGL